MPRDTSQHVGGAPHRSTGLPADNAANAAGIQQTTRPQQAATAYPREIPDSQGDTQDDTQDNTQDVTQDITEHPREIPDSQDDPADYLSSIGDADDRDRTQQGVAHGSTSLNQGEDLEGFETEEEPDPEGLRQAILDWFDRHDTEALAPTQVPSEVPTVEVVRSKPLYTLRKKGRFCNGRLAAGHPDNKNMEETATQPATQPQDGASRLHFSISEQDQTDVICILHPTSPAAHRAVELVIKQCPQHILQNEGLEHLLEYDSDELQPAGSTRPDLGSQGSRDNEEVTEKSMDDDVEPSNPSAKDIALRLSSVLLNPCLGFTFGRNPRKCDIPLVKNDNMRISASHFRIYLNTNGVLMAEDTSTNGTWVDHYELNAKSSNPNISCRRSIMQGNMITIPNGDHEPIRFIVGYPARTGQEVAYAKALEEYSAHIRQLERQATLAAQAAANGNMMPPPLFATGNQQLQGRLGTIPSTFFAASTTPYNHGMAWNGGEVYNINAQIGKGAFATVYKLSTKQNGDLVAAKEIEKRRYLKDGILDRKIHNEIEIMRRVVHPHIVHYIGYHEISTHLYIFMEYIPGGDLTPYTYPAALLTEEQCQCIAYQTMQALDYLHQNDITHRDIKPDNILIANDEPMVVKLSDFGLSKVVTGDDTFLKTFCGTLLYCAPEIYPGYEDLKRGQPAGRRGRRESKTLPYQQSVDTWGFGAVMYHLLCGKPPYEGSADHRGQAMLNCVMYNPVDWERLRRAGISDKGCDFVKRMLVHEPSQRASDAQCLQHPWLAHLYDPDAVDGTNSQRIDLSDISEETGEGEEVDEELDASQLSLHDGQGQAGVDDDDLEYDDGGGIDTPLRAGGQVPRAMSFQPRPEESAEWGDSMPSGIGSLIDRMPGVPAQGESDAGPAPTRRLYGEIGSSALGSSGLLGQDALAQFNIPPHINMSQARSSDLAEDTSMEDSSIGDTHESQVTNDGLSEHSLQYPYPLPTTTHPGPAPSLMGTEALVGQMNMASPESGVSAPSVDSKPGTPRTPISRELSPLVTAAAGSKRPAQDDYTIGREALKRSRREPTPDVVQHGINKGNRYTPPAFPASTNKHTNLTTSKVVRRDSTSAHAIDTIAAGTQTDVTMGQGQDPERPISANEPHRSRRHSSSKPESNEPHRSRGRSSSKHESNEPHRSRRHPSSKPESNIVATSKDDKRSDGFQTYSKDSAAAARGESKSHESKDKGTKQRTNSSHRSVPEGSKLSVVETKTGDKSTKGQEPKGKEKESHQNSSGAQNIKAVDVSKENKGRTDSHDGSTSSTDSSFAPKAPQPDPKDPGFVRPSPVYGKLVPLPGSIINHPVYLHQRINTYGRGDDNTIQFANIMEKRVSRNAFDLVFWRPGIEKEMANGADWTKDAEVFAIIKTRSSRWIWVNGVQVRQGADCWQFGKLYTGDKISVFDDVADKHTTSEFLTFECNFHVGVSRNRRPANEPFQLDQEREKYQKAIAKELAEQARAEKKAAKKAKRDAEASGDGTASDVSTATAMSETPTATAAEEEM